MILTEEQLLIQQSARKFAQERLAPNSAKWEAGGAVSRARSSPRWVRWASWA